MKIGDIKIEAIKLMFTNYSFDMGIDDLQKLVSDENYGSYIVNMNGSINRALDRIQNACVLAPKAHTFNTDDGNALLKYDLKNISDLFLIDRVSSWLNKTEYCPSVSFYIEGDTLILENTGDEYTILYFPTIKSLTNEDADTDDMWLPDYIARLIPYFIKSDLYQEEEPDLAAAARNLFEASLEDIKTQRQINQTYVHQTYRMF